MHAHGKLNANVTSLTPKVQHFVTGKLSASRAAQQEVIGQFLLCPEVVHSGIQHNGSLGVFRRGYCAARIEGFGFSQFSVHLHLCNGERVS